MMLFHNEFCEMSATNTPTRRGVQVSSLDTRGQLSWPQTPTDPGHDSRRPSLALSAMSDATGSGSSSIYSYSQPATPVQSMHYSNDNFTHHHWSDHGDGKGVMSATIPEGCVPQIFNASFGTAMSGVESMPNFSSTGHANVGDAFSMPPLPHSSRIDDAWSTQQADVAFNMNINMRLGPEPVSSSMYTHPSVTVPTGLGPSAFQDYAVAGASMYTPSQGVDPSEVQMVDCQMDDYPGYACHEESPNSYTPSFDSSQASFSSGWVDVRRPSPDMHYYDPVDEDDFIPVKHEAAHSFSPAHLHSSTVASSSRARHHSHLYSSGSSSTSSPHSHTHKSTTRPRKPSKTFAQFNAANIKVTYQGTRWTPQTQDGKRFPIDKKQVKTSICHFIDPLTGVPCPSKFLRAEHLKRHMNKHTNVRQFPCPLPKCKSNKGIGRSDNASDHFKTHLRGDKAGKRNKHCDFETLEKAILESYEDRKKAVKLLGKLREWYFKVELPAQEVLRLQEQAGLGMGGGVGGKKAGKRARR